MLEDKYKMDDSKCVYSLVGEKIEQNLIDISEY